MNRLAYYLGRSLQLLGLATITSVGTDAVTQQGNFALQLVQESTQSFARQNIEELISANKQARTKRRG